MCSTPKEKARCRLMKIPSGFRAGHNNYALYFHSIQYMVKQRPSLRCHSSALVWAPHLPHWHDTDRWKALQVQSSIVQIWENIKVWAWMLTCQSYTDSGSWQRTQIYPLTACLRWILRFVNATHVDVSHPDAYTIHFQVYPTQTKYTFEQAGIQLNLTVSLHGIGHAYMHTMDC